MWRLCRPGTRFENEDALLKENKATLAQLEKIRDGAKLTNGPGSGVLFDVDLDVEPEDLLDWDAPLSQQPEVVKRLKARRSELAKTEGTAEQRTLDRINGAALEQVIGAAERGEWSGKTLYRALASDDVEASRILGTAGVPGLRFLDQGSRAGPAAEGTRNVVMFPGTESKINITGRD